MSNSVQIVILSDGIISDIFTVDGRGDYSYVTEGTKRDKKREIQFHSPKHEHPNYRLLSVEAALNAVNETREEEIPW